MADALTAQTSKFKNENVQDFEIVSMGKIRNNAFRFNNESKRMPKNRPGPTQFWEQFYRQADALETAAERSKTETVCTFVYEKENGYREFIVAHPEVYWWHIMLQPPEMRCSYEVIPADSPCCLYLDLEFKRDLNQQKDGACMTRTIVRLFCSYLQKYWGLTWGERNIVNLDSTTDIKFSRHLIFCTKDIAFCNNLHAGRLVKGVCREIEEYLENSVVLHDILSCYERKELEDLFVETGKGKQIFIDTGVYTRNRQFRIYKSTKWGKMSHLEVAPESKHVSLCSINNKELAIFLDSLISYFPNKKDLRLLEIWDDESVCVKRYAQCSNRIVDNINRGNFSYCRQLDDFILSLVKPGKIRICKHIAGRNIIIFEIIGNRYCANISREHKSNNVFWIADLNMNKVYQKCHDEDCASFMSNTIDIPPEVSFYLDNEYDRLISELELDEQTSVTQ